MNSTDILKKIYDDISNEINSIWDKTIEGDEYENENIVHISKILDKCDEELKNDLIEMAQLYCFRLYEDLYTYYSQNKNEV